jgi:hypothetical protein
MYITHIIYYLLYNLEKSLLSHFGISRITFRYFTYHIAVISHKNKNFSLKHLKKVHFQNLLYF